MYAVEGEAGEGGGDVSVGRGGGGEGGKKTRIAGLYQPPTHDELRTLKETQNLYQSNLMRLQVHHLSLITLLYVKHLTAHASARRGVQFRVTNRHTRVSFLFSFRLRRVTTVFLPWSLCRSQSC